MRNIVGMLYLCELEKIREEKMAFAPLCTGIGLLCKLSTCPETCQEFQGIVQLQLIFAVSLATYSEKIASAE